MNEPYQLFAGEIFNSLGGWHDYVGSFATVDDALSNVPVTAEWFHVVFDNTIIVED